MLKKIGFLSLLGIALTITCASSAFPAFKCGIEFGVNYSTLIYDKKWEMWDQIKWRPLLTGGVAVEYPISSLLAAESGLRFVQYGHKVVMVTTTSDVRDENNQLIGTSTFSGDFKGVQNYLAVPVKLKIYPLPSTKLYACAGMEIGYLLSASDKNNLKTVTQLNNPVGVQTTLDSDKTDLTDEVNRLNLAIEAGLGIQFPFAEHFGLVEARFTQGLQGNAKKPENWVSDWKTRGIQLVVGLIW